MTNTEFRYPKRSAPPDKMEPEAKRNKMAGPGAGGMSFAAKMMKKMGFQEGQGLGKQGSGMATPIEVKLRPQGVGVGAVKERTPQQKAEARRAAERKGETYHDSSEEERRQRKKDKAAVSKAKTGVSSKSAGPVRPRKRVRTVAEIEAEEGFTIPNIFKELIDHTGPDGPVTLTSTSGLFKTEGEAERDKLRRRARVEVETFADSYRGLQERESSTGILSGTIQEDIQRQQKEIVELQEIADAVEKLNIREDAVVDATMTPDQLERQFSILTTKLASLQEAYKDDALSLGMSDLAIAAIHPLFKRFISVWELGEKPEALVHDLQNIAVLLELNTQNAKRKVGHDDHGDLLEYSGHSIESTAYESMIYSLWLPKVRTLIDGDWNATEPGPMLAFVDAWKYVLPTLVYDIVVNQLIARKLIDLLKAWKPRSVSSTRSTTEPHVWLFPWLQHLDAYHLDPQTSDGLLAEVRRKFRSTFSSWHISKGIVGGIDEWFGVKALRPELHHILEVNLLPQLSRYLDARFDMQPADQIMEPFEKVMEWQRFFTAEKFSRIFIASFFPKWLNALYLWLIIDLNWEEVGQWVEWWLSQFPQDINHIPEVDATWRKGLDMIEEALGLGLEHVKEGLSVPVTKATFTATEVLPVVQEKKAFVEPEVVSFEKVVEQHCEEENVLLLPLRTAHPDNGLPLIRITASASGKGGFIAYFKGDLLLAQNKQNKTDWDPVDVFADGVLIALAEGR